MKVNHVKRSKYQYFAMIAVLVVVVAIRMLRTEEHAANGKPASSGMTEAPGGTSQGAPKENGGVEVYPKETAKDHLMGCLSVLRSSSDANASSKALRELRDYLDSLPREVSSAAIADFLKDPALNADSHNRFSIGKDGMLDGYPTLRVALLDWIGQIDPAKARGIAREMLETSKDADEWAVSLRNYSRTGMDSSSREYLRAKTEELIRNPAWRANPSIGYFQSFDVLVHIRATESAGLLADLVSDRSSEGAATAHAAFLALDRLTFRDTSTMLEKIVSRKDLCRARGEMVANLMARADLGNPDQEQLVRSYLAAPERTEAEIRAFTGVYPNANFAISKNLLSRNLTLSSNEIMERAINGMAVVEQWLVRPDLSAVRTELLDMRRRLENIMSQNGSMRTK
jgi:hypothetical protein